MTALLLFVSTFVLVFALGLQSLNVNGGHKLLAALTSLVISLGQLAVLKIVPGPTDTIELLAYITGGPLGILASMALHPYLVQLIARPSNSSPRPQAPILQELNRHSTATNARPSPTVEARPAHSPDARRATSSEAPARSWSDKTWPHKKVSLAQSQERDHFEATRMTLSLQHERLQELARDIVNPEGYGHAMPLEVKNRARDILALIQRPEPRIPQPATTPRG